MAKVINVPGMGPTLFSAVFAHSLELGDLIISGPETDQVRRVQGIEPGDPGELDVQVGTGFRGPRYCWVFGVNEPVLRAVGARAGGVR